MAKVQYRSNSPVFKPRDAEVIGVFLEKLSLKHGQMLTSKQVLDAATPGHSPIHKYFEWDNSAAANRYRLDQAAGLLRAIVVIEEGKEFRPWCPAISIDGQSTYVTVDFAKTHPYIQDLLLDKALQDIRNWALRFKTEARLEPILKAINQVEANVKNRRKLNES